MGSCSYVAFSFPLRTHLYFVPTMHVGKHNKGPMFWGVYAKVDRLCVIASCLQVNASRKGLQVTC